MKFAASVRRVCVIALLVACGDGSVGSAPALAPIPATPSSLDVEVGTGSVEYLAIPDGVEVDLVRGVQGGWHIWTGLRVRDASIADVRVNLFARFDDGTAAGDPSAVAVRLEGVAGGDRTTFGMRDFIHDGTEARGRKIILRAEVLAPDGRHGAGERTVVAR